MTSATQRPTGRREEIIDAAFDLVQEVGMAGLRIRDLAERVGVTEGALYRHFPSKEAILVALAERVQGRLLGPIETLAEREDMAVQDRLEAILRHHLRMLLETDSLPVLLLAEASFSESEELKTMMQRIVSTYLATLEGLAAELPGRGELAPAEISVLLLGLPAALAIRHRLMPDPALEARLSGPVVREYLERLLPG